jgi:hypothetical protein
METMNRKERIARDTFWGKNPRLMEHIKHLRGYEMDGQWWPANSITLGETMDAVYCLPDKIPESLLDREITE